MLRVESQNWEWQVGLERKKTRIKDDGGVPHVPELLVLHHQCVHTLQSLPPACQ